MSTILIDRSTAALLGRLAAEPSSGPGRAVPGALATRPAPPTLRPEIAVSGATGARVPVTVRRTPAGGVRLARRLRCGRSSAVAALSTPRGRSRRTRRVRVRAGGRRPSLHLTRRGRVVALLLLLVFLSVAFGVGRVTATALGGSSGSGAEVVVQRGDSLFSIAERLRPNADPREVAADLMAVNGLSSPSLQIGQHLRLP